MDWNHARERLRPHDAHLVLNAESRSVPVENRKELQIGWTFSTLDEASLYEKYIQQYTWATNEDPQKYTTNPEINGIEYEGIWRQAFTTRIRRETRERRAQFLVVLTLRRGWATSIDWDESLIQERRVTDGNDKSVPYGTESIAYTTSFDTASALVIRFPNIAPEAVHDCLASFDASTYSNISVQGETLTDTWWKAFAVSSKTEDGTSVIDVALTRNRYTVALYQNAETPNEMLTYKIYEVPRGIANTIVDTWKSKGRSADIQLSTSSDLCVVSLYDNRDTEDELSHISATSCAFFVLTTEYTNMEDLPVTPENTMGITYRGRFRKDPNTGLYNGTIEKMVRQTLHVSEYRSENTHGNYVLTERWDGLYYISASDEYKEATLAITTDAETGEYDIGITYSDAIELPNNIIYAGNTWQVSKSRNEDCTYNIVVNDRTEIAGESDDYDVLDHKFQKNTAKDIYNSAPDDIELSAEAGQILNASVRFNKQTGLVDVTKTTQTAKGVDSVVIGLGETEFTEDEQTVDRNQASRESSITRNTGETVDYRSTVNEFGYYDNQTNKRTAKHRESGVGDVSKSLFSSRKQNQLVNNAKLIEADERVTGKITFAQSTLNQFGYYDGAKGEELAGSEIEITSQSSSRFDGHSDITEIRNSDEAITAPDHVQGVVFNSQSTINQFGYYDGRKEARYAKPIDSAITGLGETEFTEDELTVDRNQESRESSITRNTGETVDYRSTVNEFGYYDNQTNKRTAKYVNAGEGDVSKTQFSTRKQNQLVNNAALIQADATTQGKITFAQSTINQFGYYDGVKGEESVGSELEITSQSSSSARSYSDITEIRNSDEAITAPDHARGIVYNAQSAINQFGCYDGRKEARHAKAQTRSSLVSRDSAFATQSDSEKINAEDPETISHITGRIVEARHRINDYDLYDISLSSTDAKAVTGPLTNTGSTWRTLEHTQEFRNSAAPIEIEGGSERGKVKRSSSSLNDFGYYDGAIVEQTIDLDAQEAEFESLSSTLATGRTAIYNNQETIPDLTASAIGFTRRQNASINQFGYYDIQEDVVEDHPINFGHTSRRDAYTTGYREIYNGHRNDAPLATVSSVNAGETKTAGASRRQNGAYDIQIESTVDTAREWDFPFERDGDQFHIYNWRNSTTDVPAWLDDKENILGQPSLEYSPTGVWNATVLLGDSPGGSSGGAWRDRDKYTIYWWEDWVGEGNITHEVYMNQVKTAYNAEAFMNSTTVATPDFLTAKNVKESRVVPNSAGFLCFRIRQKQE